MVVVLSLQSDWNVPFGAEENNNLEQGRETEVTHNLGKPSDGSSSICGIRVNEGSQRLVTVKTRKELTTRGALNDTVDLIGRRLSHDILTETYMTRANKRVLNEWLVRAVEEPLRDNVVQSLVQDPSLRSET